MNNNHRREVPIKIIIEILTNIDPLPYSQGKA
jgi:hypothetical protein